MPVRILVFLLCQMALTMNLTAAQTCYKTGNFTNNSTYGRNRELILASLSANVSRNGGFFSGSVGQEPDKVYAFGLCRGDSSPEICYERVGTATQNILANCRNQKEAISWLPGNPPSIVRYTNRSIFGILEQDPSETSCNENYIDSNLTRFDQIWENLTNSLVSKASMGSSRLKFATEERDFSSLESIYSLMQCTPDLSQSDCASCLSVSVNGNRRRCRGRRGGYVHKPNCLFRWELFPFYDSSADAPPIFPPPPAPTKKEDGGISSGTVVIIVVPIVVFVVVGMLAAVILLKRSKKTKHDDQDDRSLEKSLQFDFKSVRVATENFSDKNMLGQGGFGAVYKGKLQDGQEIAVKRLSGHSSQGQQEFKNEVLLLAKLQHRNLVRLLGFSLGQKERILIYELLPNSSLDHFIFDTEKRKELNWSTRYKIINGIARGVLYLHEDSRLKIIHRDLKVSNVLLDKEMNPKISDFGTARICGVDEHQGNTSRIVGTFGYMSPEYAMHGQFSVKSDVYSFGVSVLEIISGKKNNSFHPVDGFEDLLSYSWDLWSGGAALELLDPTLRDCYVEDEVIRSIHIGLLCIQEDAAKRPNMTTVVPMLDSYIPVTQAPQRPASFFRYEIEFGISTNEWQLNRSRFFFRPSSSINEVSISETYPR